MAREQKEREVLTELFEIYRDLPCLWDLTCESYKDSTQKKNAWDILATKLKEIDPTANAASAKKNRQFRNFLHTGIEEEPVIRSKWKSLRDIFKRELMKKCETTSKGIMLYRGKWRCFMSMLFLHKNITAQILKNDAREVSNSSTEPELEPEGTKEEIVNNDEDMDESDDNNEAFDAGNVFAADFQSNQDPLPVKRRQSEDDYDLMFLKSLVPFFRKLDPIRKLKIRNKIQDIIINEISAQGHFNSMH